MAAVVNAEAEISNRMMAQEKEREAGEKEDREEDAEEEIDFEGLILRYFGEIDDVPFENKDEEWRDWSRFVDLLCAIMLMQKEANPPQSLDRIGSLLNDAELAMALEPREKERFSEWARLRMVFNRLLEKSGKPAEDGEILPLGRLLAMEMLSPIEWMAFLMAFCVQRNRKYERVFGVLQEQGEGIVMPTVGLVFDVCSLFLIDEEKSFSILMDEGSFLNRLLLETVRIPEGLSNLSRPLRVNREAYYFALDERVGLGNLGSCAEERNCREEKAFICHENLVDELLETYAGLTGFDESGVIYLKGEKGSGRTFLAEQLSATVGADMLLVSVDRLLAYSQDQIQKYADEMIRRCFFRGEFLYLKDFPSEREGQEAMLRVVSLLCSEMRILLMGGESFPEKVFPKDVSVYIIEVPFPGMAAQKRFWTLFAENLGILYDEDVLLSDFVSKYNMTPGYILSTLRAARLHGKVNEEGDALLVGKMLIEREIRGSSARNFGDYATKLTLAFTWEDIQLTRESAGLLQKAIDRVRLKSVVNGDYGFGKKLPYGNGVSIVLYGPPGTGKTMTAQLLARELGLDLYRIDLSQIESKYIRETQKNLKQIFDTAKYSNAILFFDEADALFAKRTEVNGANERHANAETAFLLQKVEEYNGVSILATNVFTNFDEAFKRRMTFLIPVRWPEEDERIALWKKMFPKEAPLAEDVDFAYYASVGEMTGSWIKNAAVAAAYRAAKEHRPIAHRDILEAIEEEYKKNGRTMRILPEQDKLSQTLDELIREH